MSSRGPISQSSSMPSFSLLRVVVVVVVAVVFVLPPRRAQFMCYCATSEREREKQSSSLFFISFYCKVIVIFAYVPQTSAESQMSFCANELRAFFFVLKSTNTLNNATRQTLSLCDDGPNFLSLCRFESSHVFVETHLERERESRRNALKRAHRKIYIIGGTKGTNCNRMRF
jgi:hypothetical protein